MRYAFVYGSLSGLVIILVGIFVLRGATWARTIAIIVVTIIMALGGIFGVMNTMFAAVSQRSKDIGVLRILGFSRVHVQMSFLLESLVLAIAGGAVGCLAGSFVHGTKAASIVGSGQGGGRRGKRPYESQKRQVKLWELNPPGLIWKTVALHERVCKLPALGTGV